MNSSELLRSYRGADSTVHTVYMKTSHDHLHMKKKAQWKTSTRYQSKRFLYVNNIRMLNEKQITPLRSIMWPVMWEGVFVWKTLDLWITLNWDDFPRQQIVC